MHIRAEFGRRVDSYSSASYQRSLQDDVYLLDDPLSAVDAHVGRHLYTHVSIKNDMVRKDSTQFAFFSLTEETKETEEREPRYLSTNPHRFLALAVFWLERHDS